MRGQYSGNTPPVLRLDRNWVIPDNEEPGSVVARVRAEDAERDSLVFGLEEATLLPDGSEYFSIDSKTGVVYVNKSLEDQVCTLCSSILEYFQKQ